MTTSSWSLEAALQGLLAVRPCNWDDGEDPEQAAAWRAADAALLDNPDGWRPVETAPQPGEGEARVHVLLSWTTHDGKGAVGEAYWHPTDPEGGAWWWANTAPHEYGSDCIEQSITGRITAWRPMPPPHQERG